jgi:hypothetical protein
MAESGEEEKTGATPDATHRSTWMVNDEIPPTILFSTVFTGFNVYLYIICS